MTVTSIAPTQSDVLTALRAWLLDLFPTQTVIEGQANRAAEPSATGFIVMSPIYFNRLATNFDNYSDVVFTGSVSGTTLTVSSMRSTSAPIVNNSLLFGVNVPFPPPVILSQLSGVPGGVGTYQINQSFSLASETLGAGTKNLQISSEMKVQLDFHSAVSSFNGTSVAADTAEMASTAFRDEAAVTFFQNLPAPQNQVFPFYADDPEQRPFINDQQQYEWRWSLDVLMEVDQLVTVSQTFADSINLGLVSATTLPLLVSITADSTLITADSTLITADHT